MTSVRFNIGFLVDANYNLGMGNVIRCLNLAKNLCQNSFFENIFFFSKKFKYSNDFIKKSSFSLKITPKSNKNRIDFIKKQIKILKINILIIDIPGIDESFLNEIIDPKLIIAILDTSNKKLINLANIIINILPRIDLSEKNVDNVFQGIKYWILNPDLVQKKLNYNPHKKVKKILMTFGTTDPKELTKNICLLIKDSYPNNYFKVIIGPGFLNKEFFHNFCQRHDNFECLENPDNFYDIMANTDISISVGGGTSFELMYLGIPMIILPNSPDNSQLGKILSSRKMALFVESFPNLNDNDLKEKLTLLIENYKLREDLNKNCKKEFNENGSIKIESIILNYIKNHPEKLIESF